MNVDDPIKAVTTAWKAIQEQATGGKRIHKWPARLLGSVLGVFFLHAAAIFAGLTGQTSWSAFVEYLLNSPLLGPATYVGLVSFWGGILSTVPGGQFLRIFFRGVTIPMYLYYLVGKVML